MPYINMNGEITKPKQRKKKKQLSHQEFVQDTLEFLNQNTEGFVLYYIKNGIGFSLSDLGMYEFSEAVSALSKEQVRKQVYNILNDYFDDEESDSIIHLEETNEGLDQYIEQYLDAVDPENE